MHERLIQAMGRALRRRMDICEINLTGMVVATECANGAYAATAAAAAAAGAEVWCFGRDSRHATFGAAADDVRRLAVAAGEPRPRIFAVRDKAEIPWKSVRLVTNSGHLRPISAWMIERLPSDAVISLMYEAWEMRDGDVDLRAAAKRGIMLIGVDEHHPACGAFEFVGDLALSEMMRQRWNVRDARIGVVGDNAFVPPVTRCLTRCGATVVILDWPNDRAPDPFPAEVTKLRSADIHSGCVEPVDVTVVAATPNSAATISKTLFTRETLTQVVIRSGCYGCVQLWGDLDREALDEAGIAVAPAQEPEPGHQGIAMSDAGFEAVIRLQVGGLAAALHGALTPTTNPKLSTLAQPIYLKSNRNGHSPEP